MFCALTRSLYEEQTSLGDLSRADLHIWGIFTASTKIFPHLVFPLNLITIVYVLTPNFSLAFTSTPKWMPPLYPRG